MIRPACLSDSDSILQLVNTYATDGLMLRKSPFDVYRHIQSFFVYEEADVVLGCARLAVVWKDIGEVASLAVSQEYLNKGIGRYLVSACVERAKDIGLPRVFALTYQCDFFKKCGFRKVSRENLPHKVFGDCLMCPKVECCDESAFILDIES